MRLDSVNKRIYVRQSWLNDVMLCPERARLATQFPTWRSASVATNIGTAVHHGIEMVLTNECDFATMAKAVHEKYDELAAQPHKQQNVDPEDVPTFLDNMSAGFYTEILPHVALYGACEVKFDVPLNMTAPNGWAIHIEGTMDYVAPDGVIWDWKTSGRAYNERDRQTQSIQASIYSLAAGRQGLVPDPTNVDFRYGVMMRQKSVKTQVVRLKRDTNHSQWVQQQIARTVNMAVRLGFDSAWLMNDQGNLCSAKWCDYWSVCKGAIVPEQSLALPT